MALFAGDVDVEHCGESMQNESLSTAADDIVAFLRSLLANPDRLPLVEVIVKNCGLDGSPQLRLNDQENESLAPAIHQLAAMLGSPLDVIHDIESIKVYAFKRRVRLRFERVEEDGARFIVRYTEQALGSKEQRVFEQMMEREHGIKVLSTEKRHAC